MTTTPQEPLEDPDIVPSGDPDLSPDPVAPGTDPETTPSSEPPQELWGVLEIRSVAPLGRTAQSLGARRRRVSSSTAAARSSPWMLLRTTRVTPAS